MYKYQMQQFFALKYAVYVYWACLIIGSYAPSQSYSAHTPFLHFNPEIRLGTDQAGYNGYIFFSKKHSPS